MSTPSDEIGGVSELVLGSAYQRIIKLAGPPPGNGLVVTVPGGVAWRLLMLFSQLATSDVVGTRYPYLTITDGTWEVCHLPVGITVTASSVVWLNWIADPGSTLGSVAYFAVGPLPGRVLLMPGWSVLLSVLNMDVGDSLHHNAILVTEYRLGPPEPRQIVRDVPLVE